MRWKGFILLICCLSPYVRAEKRDFKGLFGSYRRERFVENEARSTDFGMDLSLSTLLPVSPIIRSRETTGGNFNPLYYAAFFNAELSLLLSLNYNFQTFLSIGYYDYATRKENASTEGQVGNPRFHVFEMTAVPVLAGFRYRMGTEDLVPYIGVGLGMTNIRQKASYDYSENPDLRTINAVSGEIKLGCEFYFSSRGGIRLEVSGFIMNLPGDTYAPSPTPEILPTFEYAERPILVRYASGIFWLL